MRFEQFLQLSLDFSLLGLGYDSKYWKVYYNYRNLTGFDHTLNFDFQNINNDHKRDHYEDHW